MNRFLLSSGAIQVAILLASLIQLSGSAAAAAPSTELSQPAVLPTNSPAPNSPGTASARSPSEQAIARRLKSTGADGEICWIESKGEDFLAMFRESYEAQPHGGLIINIAPGAIVDARPLHRTLARTAAAAGWAALSIQPIITESEPMDNSVPAETNPRMDAAFDFLVSKGIQNIVFIGDAGGAVDAMSFIVAKASPAISGFVGLGQWDALLERTQIPILDIAGTRDHPAIALKEKRRMKFRQREKPIEQLEIDGAGPGFYGYEDQIAKRVRGWLERVAPGVALLQ